MIPLMLITKLPMQISNAGERATTGSNRRCQPWPAFCLEAIDASNKVCDALALSLRPVESLDQGQGPEGARCNWRPGWDVLIYCSCALVPFIACSAAANRVLLNRHDVASQVESALSYYGLAASSITLAPGKHLGASTLSRR
jgi:hypothetical protein